MPLADSNRIPAWGSLVYRMVPAETEAGDPPRRDRENPTGKACHLQQHQRYRYCRHMLNTPVASATAQAWKRRFGRRTISTVTAPTTSTSTPTATNNSG